MCGKARLLHVQANQEKLRLEKKQRAARAAADRGDAIKPRWFKANPGKQDPDDLAFVYTGGYFESRAAHNYEVCVCVCVVCVGGGRGALGGQPCSGGMQSSRAVGLELQRLPCIWCPALLTGW